MTEQEIKNLREVASTNVTRYLLIVGAGISCLCLTPDHDGFLWWWMLFCGISLVVMGCIMTLAVVKARQMLKEVEETR